MRTFFILKSHKLSNTNTVSSLQYSSQLLKMMDGFEGSFLGATPIMNDKRMRKEVVDSPKFILSKTELSDLLDEKILPLQEKLSRLNTTFSSSKIEKLEKENSDLKTEVKALKNKLVTNELYLRKNNVRFYGIKETGSKHQREDCEAVVLAKLQDTYPEVNSRSFERVHRLGPPKQGYSRPIIARMGHYKDKMMLFARRKILKEKTGISISDDFPKEIEEKRKEMYPIYRHAQETGYNTQLKGDKLFVNGRVYTPETLQQLPPVLRPELVFSPSQNGITAFFTKASPLSNHFITNFSVDNEVFNCVEQFLMKQKAMFFKDTETATKIMRENDPVRQKALGKTVKNYQARSGRVQ